MIKHEGVHTRVRQSHRQRVLQALREHGPQSRSELGARTRLSRTTVSEIVAELLQEGAIVAAPTGPAGPGAGSGRPPARLALDPASAQFLGVDLGHRRARVAVADASHDIIASGSTEYGAHVPWPERLQATLDLINRVSAETGVHFHALQGIGIGVAGPFSTREPATVAGTATTGAEVTALAVDAFSARYGAPVVADNNTRYAALAEAIYAGDENVQDLLYLRLSDGIGGGIIVGGRLVVGSAGFAGELGHISASDSDALCRCGKRGCLETVASVPAILAECRRRGVPASTVEDIRAAVVRSDPVVDAVLRDAGRAVGRVLGASAIALNPAEIVVGGEIARIAPALLDQARVSLAYDLSSVPGGLPTIRAARLSDDDGARGAIAAIFHSSPLLDTYPGLPAPHHPVRTAS